MAAIVDRPVGLAVMAQPEVVAGFMGGRLGDVGFGVGQVVGVDPRRPVPRIAGRIEDIHVRHPAGGGRGIDLAIGVRVARDEHMRRPEAEGCGPLSGHVDIERRIIFSHPHPDVFDGGLLGIAERGGIRIRAERQGGNGSAGQGCVPFGVADRIASKIQKQDIRGAGPAVKHQGCGERTHRNRRRLGQGLNVARRRRAFQRHVADIKNAALAVGMQIVQILLGKMKRTQPAQCPLLGRERQIRKLFLQTPGGHVLEPRQRPGRKSMGIPGGLTHNGLA